MGVKKTNNRFLIKRSTVNGVTPTIPGTGATNVYDHTLGGWATTDIYEGELFMNVADDKIWMRTTGGTWLLGYSGMTGDFVDLTDTPADYVGYGGYGLRVNTGETALEFYELTANTFLSLPDTPSAFETGKTLVSNSATSSLEWQDIYSTFVSLTDTPSSIDANYIVVGNSAGTALEMVQGSTIFIDSDTVQTINSAKTFSDTTIMSGLTLSGTLNFNGQEIYSISTDTGFTSATNNQLATSYATKMYVDDQLFGTGVTSYVTLGGDQTITGVKTFDNTVVYNSGFTINEDLNVNANLYVTGSSFYDLTSYIYLGQEDLDGSYRQYVDVDGNFSIERRQGGSWNTNVFAITNSGVSVGTYTGSTGYYNFSVGYENQANGTYSFAGGSNCESSGTKAFSFGQSNQALGLGSFAIGSQCVADGAYSFVGGTSAVSSGRTCFGFYSRVVGSHSGLTGGADRSVILGGADHTCTHANSVILGGSGITSDADDTVYCRNLKVLDAWSGSWVNAEGDTVVVVDGIITGVVSP